MAGKGRGGGDHDLRQGGADGHHRGTDEQLRQVEPPGQRRSAIHKPVAALDQESRPMINKTTGISMAFPSYTDTMRKRLFIIPDF